MNIIESLANASLKHYITIMLKLILSLIIVSLLMIMLVATISILFKSCMGI